MLPRAVRPPPPPPPRPEGAKENERVSVRGMRTRRESRGREMRGARVHAAAPGLPLAGQRGRGVERGVGTERAAGQGGGGEGSRVGARRWGRSR